MRAREGSRQTARSAKEMGPRAARDRQASGEQRREVGMSDVGGVILLTADHSVASPCVVASRDGLAYALC